MDMITCQREKYDQVVNDILPYLSAHSAEVEDVPALEPDLSLYESASNSGGVVFYTARYNGRLIAYNVFWLYNHAHHGMFFAANDLFYVHPRYRHRGLGSTMVKFAEEDLTRMGVEVIHYNFKTDHDHVGLMDNLGYNTVEYVYSKHLG